jgi:uncharacterized protein (TIGR02266 family)
LIIERWDSSEYTPSLLKSINLYSWASSDSFGIILTFDFSAFFPSYFKKIKAWAEESGIKLYELMPFGQMERNEFKNKFILTSDLKFTGDYDIALALNKILTRINTTLGRKNIRYNASLKVTFESKEQLIHGYTQNISKGGIFVATETSFLPESKLKLLLSLPNSSKDVKVTGMVVHTVSPEQAKLTGTDRIPGLGIQFLEFKEDGEMVLDSYFNALNKEEISLS